jgi:hypothetical protein
VSQLSLLIKETVPQGWYSVIETQFNYETLSRSAKVRLVSAPDVTGHKASGVIYLDRYDSIEELVHAIHCEAARMDAGLMHELTLA